MLSALPSALALALIAQVEETSPVTIQRNVRIMERVLDRTLAAAQATTASDLESLHHLGAEDARANSVLNLYRRSQSLLVESSVEGDYVPGFGVLFRATVPVPVEWVPLQEEDEGPAKPSEEASLWDEMSREVDGIASTESPLLENSLDYARADVAFFRSIVAQSLQHAENHRLVLQESAIESIQNALTQSLASYAIRLGLEPEESVAIRIKLTAAGSAAVANYRGTRLDVGVDGAADSSGGSLNQIAFDSPPVAPQLGLQFPVPETLTFHVPVSKLLRASKEAAVEAVRVARF